MSGRLSAPATLSRSGGLVGGVFGALAMAALEAVLKPYLERSTSQRGAPDAGIGLQAAFGVQEPTTETASLLTAQR